MTPLALKSRSILAGLTLAALTSATARAAPSNVGAITVLAENLKNPTTVALRNGNAFVPEGRLAQIPVIGQLFTVREISLQGAGILNGSFCNDIVIEADGDLLVAESFVGQIFRIDAGETLIDDSAQLFLQTAELAPPAAGQFGANGLTIIDDVLFVANTFAGTLARFDLNAADIAGSVQTAVLSEGNAANVVLSGPDGILGINDTQALVVENGFAGVGRQALLLVTFVDDGT